MIWIHPGKDNPGILSEAREIGKKLVMNFEGDA